MLTGLVALERTDWPRLLHAYGRATDTPEHLRALVGTDAKARGEALYHLRSAILHQGTPWPATAPTALVIAGLLQDSRLDETERPVRAELVSFLAAVVGVMNGHRLSVEAMEEQARFNLEPFLDAEDDDALYEDDEAADALVAQSVLACVRITPVVTDFILASLDDGDARVRACAAMAAVVLATASFSKERQEELGARLDEMARKTASTAERCALVLALGDLGRTPTAYLSDKDPTVRLCAALAPGLVADDRATRELLTVLEQHAAEVNGWFEQKPPQLAMQPRFNVVARLLARGLDLARIADAAIAVARTSRMVWVDWEWGPLLVAAFPDGRGEVKTAAQRAFLAALVDNHALWDNTFGNSQSWFKKAGLPREREACAKLVHAP